MVKKLGLTSLIFGSSNKQVDSAAPSSMASSSSSMSASSWQWPSCKQPRTLSFRQQQQSAFKTMNSAYLPDSGADSCFSNSFASVDDSLSTASEAASGLVEANEHETVIRALRSDRLFFEPHMSPATSSIVLKKAKLKVKDDKGTTCCGASSTDKQMAAAFDGATAMTMDSSNPYSDFRASMEEMVMSHGAKDWVWLEEMLRWYLRANGKGTHCLIVGAFVDLLVALSDTASRATASTNRSSSSLSGTDEIKEEACTESS